MSVVGILVGYPTKDMFAMGVTNYYFYFKDSQGLCIGEELATRTLNEILKMREERCDKIDYSEAPIPDYSLLFGWQHTCRRMSPPKKGEKYLLPMFIAMFLYSCICTRS